MDSTRATQQTNSTIPKLFESDYSATTVQTTEITTPGSEGRMSMFREDRRDSDTQESLYGRSPEGLHRQDYEDLGALMRMCGIKHFDKNIRYFWTEGLLSRILTRDRVIEALQEYRQDTPTIFPETTVEALADRILAHQPKIFAVLTLLDMGPCIEQVIVEGLVDQDLPLRTNGAPSCLLYCTSGAIPDLQLVRFSSRRGWSPILREGFLKYQHALTPQFLDFKTDRRTASHKDFDSDVVLPIMEVEEGYEGGCGIVTKIKIHPDCHGFHGGSHNLLRSIKTDNNFALKQLKQKDLVDFRREVKALQRFNGFNHDHMVTLLMTWELDSKHYMLFPLARYDLDKYWEIEPLPKLTVYMARWMLKQIIGIAGALAYIHNPPANSRPSDNLTIPTEEYGRHGDLKPENLLLYDSPFDSRGILVVADLGLSTLNSILSKTQTNSRTPCTPRYKPPECNILRAKIRQSYDMWTLGCLLLEWVCWAMQGDHARADFMYSLFAPFPSGSRTDMFFDMEPKENEKYDVIVKRQVSWKIAELHASASCTQFFHELLWLIENDMIVVRAGGRIGATALQQRLGVMVKGENDNDYYQKPYSTQHTAPVQQPLDAEFYMKKEPIGRNGQLR